MLNTTDIVLNLKNLNDVLQFEIDLLYLCRKDLGEREGGKVTMNVWL